MAENSWYEEIPQFTIYTKNHADNFNQVNEKLLSNTKANREELRALGESVEAIAEDVETHKNDIELLQSAQESMNEALESKVDSTQLSDLQTVVDGKATKEQVEGVWKEAGTSVDDVYQQGIFKNTSWVGLPSGLADGQGTIINTVYNGGADQGWLLQEFISPHVGMVYSRRRVGATWSTWSQLYTSEYKPTPSAIGAVPISGGTMTGALSLGTQPIKINNGGCNRNIIESRACDANGAGALFEAGGLTVIGGGEAGTSYMNNIPDGGNMGTENAVITADGAIILRSGVQSGFADARKITMDNTGKLNLSSMGMTMPTTGASWITGKTTNNAIVFTGNSSGSYHPMIRYNMNSGNVGNLGCLGNLFGFWGYLASQTANGTNAGAYLDIANNRWTSDGAMQAGNSNGNLKRTTVSSASPSGGANGDVWIKV